MPLFVTLIYSSRTTCKVTIQNSHSSVLNDAIDVCREYMIISMHPSNHVAFTPDTTACGWTPRPRERISRQQYCFVIREYKVEYWVQRPDIQCSWWFYSVISEKFRGTASNQATSSSFHILSG